MAKIYNLFINSKNRLAGEKSSDFMLYLRNQIEVNNSQYINVNVMSFNMINSMYNVSAELGNNTFDIEVRNISTNAFVSNIFITIPDGNYSVLSLRDLLNVKMSGYIQVTYNSAQNSYTFKKTDSGFRYYFKNIKAYKMIGISSYTEITTTGVISKYVNMKDYQQVIIKTDLAYEDLNQDNISDNDSDLNVSQILFWCSKQDIEPFGCISYNNEDAGNSFSYNIVNKNISSISFRIVNEYNQPITDAGEWLLHIQFTINDKLQYSNEQIGKTLIKQLNDANFTLLNILFGNKKMLSI